MKQHISLENDQRSAYYVPCLQTPLREILWIPTRQSNWTYTNHWLKFSYSFPISSTSHLQSPFSHYSTRKTTYSETVVLWEWTKHNQTNLFSFSPCSKDWTLETSTLGITSELQNFPTIFCHYYEDNGVQASKVIAYFVLNGHVSEPQNNADFSTAMHTWPLIGNRMSCRCRKCFKLAVTNRAFRYTTTS